MQIRILLADDHALIRHGVRRILTSDPDFAVVAEACSGIEAVEMAAKFQPDVAILDIAMKELNGIDATVQLLQQSPQTNVLILSMFNDERFVTRAVKAGIRGYLLKDSVEEDLLRAVRLAHAGQAFFSPAVARVLSDCFCRNLKDKQIEDRYELLTERERQVYQMLAEGQSNKAVAGRLNLSVHTIETHRIRIMNKLDVHNAAELALSAVRRGLVN
jgi:two-component system, NarL family, response regulator NreC